MTNEETFGLEILKEKYPEAWEALPDIYREDSCPCFTFFIDGNNLCAEYNGEWIWDNTKWLSK
jgi:hypothetical protein